MKSVKIILSLFMLVVLFYGCSGSGKIEKKYNIILVAVDTLRADHLHCYGYKYQTSPNIDAFAKKSLQFDYAFCPIPKTSASFASMMTGLHPFIHKTKPNRGYLQENFQTLAEILKSKGYHTFAVVDNANLSKHFQFHQGFETYIEVWNEIEDKPESTPFITNKILSFLKEKKDKPFFLWANYIETHAPYMPPQQFVEERAPGRDIRGIKQRILPKFMKKIMEANNTYNEGHYLALYDGAIRYIDAEVGKIINEFFKQGLDKNTIFVFISDHGEELGERNLFYNHGPLTFTSSSRVPLLLHLPGQKHRRIKIPVSVMDVYPTILGRLHLDLPYPIQGVDLLRAEKNRSLYIIGQIGTHAVVVNNFQYVNVSDKLSRRLDLELNYFYNIYDDPFQKNNLYNENKTLALSLNEKYTAYFDRHGYFERIRRNRKEKLSEKEKKSLETLGYL
jgi:arylsulfatase A-like enzyme